MLILSKVAVYKILTMGKNKYEIMGWEERWDYEQS